MTARGRFGLALSWPRTIAVFLIDVALLAIASHCPEAWQAGHAAWWTGVGIAAAVTIAATLTYLRIPVASAPVARIQNWYADPKALLAACTPAIDHRHRFGRDEVGIREYGGRLVTVIAVQEVVDIPGRHHRLAASHAALPVGAVVVALRQFDVRLDGADIVSVATQHSRRTWLVLRLDPQHNVAAVAARDSLAAALAAATERLAQDLDGQRCKVRPLNAAEITDVDTVALAGLETDQIRPYWRYLKHPDGYVTSFWVSPPDITGEMLDELWLPDADVTVVTTRLLARRGGVDVSVVVRYHTAKRLGGKDVWRGLNRLTGRQLAAVRASLPAPAAGRPLVMPRALSDDDDIMVPVGDAAADPAHSPSFAGAPP